MGDGKAKKMSLSTITSPVGFRNSNTTGESNSLSEINQRSSIVVEKEDESKPRKSSHSINQLLNAASPERNQKSTPSSPPPPQNDYDTGSVEERDSDHNRWYCNICKVGGQLLCCDRCPRAFHLSCLKLEEHELPDKDWYCKYCQETLARRKVKQQELDKKRQLREERERERRERKRIKEKEKKERQNNREADLMRKKAKRIIEMQGRIGADKKVKFRDKEEEKLGKFTEVLMKGKQGTYIQQLRKQLEALEKEDRELKKREESFEKKIRYPIDDQDLYDIPAALATARRPVPRESVIEGVPPELVGQLLCVWDFVDHFSDLIEISKINLNQLRSALLHPEPVRLVSDLHIRLLDLILSDRESPDYVSDEDDDMDQAERWQYEMKHAPLTLGVPTTIVLTRQTWPSVLGNLIMAVPRYSSVASPVLKEAVACLANAEYPALELCHKLAMLTFLITRVQSTEKARALLHSNMKERVERTREFNSIQMKLKREVLAEERRVKEEKKKLKKESQDRHKAAMEKWTADGKVGPEPKLETENPPAPSPPGSALSDLKADVSDTVSDDDDDDEDEDSDDEENDENNEEEEEGLSRQELLRRRRIKVEEQAEKRREKEERRRHKAYLRNVQRKREAAIEEMATSIADRDLDALESAIEQARDAGLERGRGDRLWQSKELKEAIEAQKKLGVEITREAEANARQEEFENAMSEFFVRSRCLGMDNQSVRYWRFEGDESRLFVEKVVKKTADDEKPTTTDTEDNNLSGEGESKLRKKVFSKVSSVPEENKSLWYCLSNKQEVEALLASLDVRGVRERNLKNALVTQMNYLTEMPTAPLPPPTPEDMMEESDEEDQDKDKVLSWKNKKKKKSNNGEPEVSLESVKHDLSATELWMSIRLTSKESNWVSAEAKQSQFYSIMEKEPTNLVDLCNALLILEAEVFCIVDAKAHAEEKKLLEQQKAEEQASEAAAVAEDSAEKSAEEDEDEDDDDDDDDEEDNLGGEVDDGTLLWPTKRIRNRWRAACHACQTLPSFAAALSTFIQRCEIVGIAEEDEESKMDEGRPSRRRAKTESEKRSIKERAAKKKADVYIEDDDEEEEDDEEDDDDTEYEFDENQEEEDGEATGAAKATATDDWDEFCYLCNGDGELICCDGCTNVFHPDCLGLTRIPRGAIFCGKCKNKKGKRGGGRKSRSKVVEKVSPRPPVTTAEDQWDTICKLCNTGGDLICCEGCPRSFHQECLNLKKVPNEFYCEDCEKQVCGICGKNKIRLLSHVICGNEDLSKGCDRVFHLKCVKLKKVPEGDWFCKDCS